MANPLSMQVFEQVVPLLTPPISPVPELKVVPVATPTGVPTLLNLMALFQTQARECWICKKIAADLARGKEINEDDTWHFTTCVLSWAHLQGV